MRKKNEQKKEVIREHTINDSRDHINNWVEEERMSIEKQKPDT